MSEIHIGTTHVPSVQGLEAKQVEDIVKNSSVINRVLDANRSNTSSQYRFTSGFSDPLRIIDRLLSTHIRTQTNEANEIAKRIEIRSKAIAEINRLWGLVMAETLPGTNPSNNDKTKIKNVKVSTDPDVYALDKIDSLIKNDLGDSQGIAAITGKNLSSTKDMKVSYGTMQQYNATMTAYCDTIQVDLDTLQQKFKNTMTEISSAQEELRDVRRAVVALTKG
ncbi:hypothetical protein L1D61_25430 [Vibrio mediterranei]|uniref:Uncharacterized protein n=1 Tax=Vibrio mediterranei TaxID=689 RepID=A0A3G4VJV1_9VIBR|nr:hypothetical protein [Vibrio mediterranei]AYV25086.1 hypothetical protein ECB94_27720 [Vibrio mediterranei]MCG9790497.1 hypothetical protein [Vibrio mediterranei]